MTTRTELGESPTTVERLLDKAVGPIDEVARAVRARPIDLVVIAARGMIELLGRLRAARSRLLVLSNDRAALDMGDGVPLPPVPEWLAPLVAIIPARLFAYHLARARGIDTEAPRNRKKVTLTQ
jgi:fructoselysine-6-P-deglycase FrlB-like protein